VLGRHRTRQAALDNWRLRHTGIPVEIVRTYSSGLERILVEGTFHPEDEATQLPGKRTGGFKR
jgi:hypothetical protein